MDAAAVSLTDVWLSGFSQAAHYCFRSADIPYGRYTTYGVRVPGGCAHYSWRDYLFRPIRPDLSYVAVLGNLGVSLALIRQYWFKRWYVWL